MFEALLDSLTYYLAPFDVEDMKRLDIRPSLLADALFLGVLIFGGIAVAAIGGAA